jgi:hypothetical protein
MNKPVYIMFLNTDNDYQEVKEADAKITEKLNEYIESGKKGLVQYIENIEDDKFSINFSINNYDSKKAGLQGEYNDFYEYTDNKNDAKNNKINIISMNKEKIKGFCGWINRLTH